MTANLTVTIDERNNVLKVPNAALRFTPQDTSGRSGSGTEMARSSSAKRQWRYRRIREERNGSEVQFCTATDPVLAGQTRAVWVMGQDGTPQRRRIKIGLTDGAQPKLSKAIRRR
jgi:HlyD family secretion protein